MRTDPVLASSLSTPDLPWHQNEVWGGAVCAAAQGIVVSQTRLKKGVISTTAFQPSDLENRRNRTYFYTTLPMLVSRRREEEQVLRLPRFREPFWQACHDFLRSCWRCGERCLWFDSHDCVKQSRCRRAIGSGVEGSCPGRWRLERAQRWVLVPRRRWVTFVRPRVISGNTTTERRGVHKGSGGMQSVAGE